MGPGKVKTDIFHNFLTFNRSGGGGLKKPLCVHLWFFLVMRYKSAETLANRLHNKNQICISYHKQKIHSSKSTSVTTVLDPCVQASGVLQHLCSRRTSGEEHLESTSLANFDVSEPLTSLLRLFPQTHGAGQLTERSFSSALNTCSFRQRAESLRCMDGSSRHITVL